MKIPKDEMPSAPPGDRVMLILLLVAVGAFAVMLIWLVGR
jgi:hypothetical protein